MTGRIAASVAVVLACANASALRAAAPPKPAEALAPSVCHPAPLPARCSDDALRKARDEALGLATKHRVVEALALLRQRIEGCATADGTAFAWVGADAMLYAQKAHQRDACAAIERIYYGDVPMRFRADDAPGRALQLNLAKCVVDRGVLGKKALAYLQSVRQKPARAATKACTLPHAGVSEVTFRAAATKGDDAGALPVRAIAPYVIQSDDGDDEAPKHAHPAVANVDWVGDLNGDGLPDFILARTQSDYEEGRMSVFLGCGASQYAEVGLDAPSGGNGDNFLGVRYETSAPLAGEAWRLLWFDYTWRGNDDLCVEGTVTSMPVTASARHLATFDAKAQQYR